jgi:RNA polymerase sigma-70 factor (ECF subfamily)
MPQENKSPGTANKNIDRLVKQHARTLYLYALTRIGKENLAEDIVQETLLAALQSWQSFDGNSSERTWLIGILRHKILDFFRRQHKHQSIDEHSWQKQYFDKAGHWKDKLVNWKANPQTLLESAEFRKVLLDCIRELSKIMARAFVMREIEGMKSEEICKHLDISQTNLWVRLHRARLQLRRCLEVNWFI